MSPASTIPPTPFNETTPVPSSIVAASIATTTLVGGGIVAAGIGGLVGSGGTAMGTSASSMMSLGLDQLAANIHSEAEAAVHGISLRQPSIALTFVVASQLQFLGSLSLVHNTQGPLKEFLENFTSMNLRWLFPSSNTTAEGATTCKFRSDKELNSTLEFWGNSVLIVGLLICIFFIHVAIASGIETYMILKARALDAISTARSRGISMNELSSRVLGRQRGKHSSLPLDSRDVEDSGEPGSFGSETGGNDTDAHSARDEFMECRDKSKSVWLHFPHLELVFLFFAFQGAVTSQLQALRYSEFSCPSVFFTALTFLALYPTLMVILVTRAICTRVLPESLIEFRYFPSEVGDGNSWISRIKKGWAEERSLLSWGNQGRWHTVETTDKKKWREGNRFRVGFEPLFVDFTKSGILFVLFSFFKSTAIACVGALIDDSKWQLLLLCALHTISLGVLVVLKPFANTILNGMAGISAVADALTTGLMAASASKWIESSESNRVESALMWIHIVVLCVSVIPTYIDAAAGIIETIRRKLHHVRDMTKSSGTEEYRTNKQVRAFVHGYVLSMGARTWCTMLSRNISACVKDTRAGVRKPREAQVKAKAKYNPTVGSDDHFEDIGYSGQSADRSERPRVSRGPVIDNFPHRRAKFERRTETFRVPGNNQCTDRDYIDNLNAAVGNDVAYKGALVTIDLPRRRTFDQALQIDQNLQSSGVGDDESRVHGHISFQAHGSEVVTRGRHWARGSLSGPTIDFLPRRSTGFQKPLGENIDNAGKTSDVYSAIKRDNWNKPTADILPRRRQHLIFHDERMSRDDLASPNSTCGEEKSEAKVEIPSEESGARKVLLVRRKLDGTSLFQVDIPRRKFFSGPADRKSEERAYKPKDVSREYSHASAESSKQSRRLEDKVAIHETIHRSSVLPSQIAKNMAQIHIAITGTDFRTEPSAEEMTLVVSDCRSKSRDVSDTDEENGSQGAICSIAPVPMNSLHSGTGNLQSSNDTIRSELLQDEGHKRIAIDTTMSTRCWRQKGKLFSIDLPQRSSLNAFAIGGENGPASVGATISAVEGHDDGQSIGTTRDQRPGDRGHGSGDNTTVNLRCFAGWPRIYQGHKRTGILPVPLDIPHRRPSYFDYVAAEKSPWVANSGMGINHGRDRFKDSTSHQLDNLATWSNDYNVSARSFETGRRVGAKSSECQNTTETFARSSSGIDTPTMLQGNEISKQPESTCALISDDSYYLTYPTRGSNPQRLSMTSEATGARFRLDVHDRKTFEKEDKVAEKHQLLEDLATEMGSRQRLMKCFEITASSLRDFTSRTGKYEYPISVKLPDNGKMVGPKSSEAQSPENATMFMNLRNASQYNGPGTRSALLHPLGREGKSPIRLFRRLSTIPEEEDAILSDESDQRTMTQA